MDSFAEEQLLALYRELDSEIAEASPRCEASGRCCRFTEYGHTLFLSELEAEKLLEPGIPSDAPVNRHTCPYQVNRLCTARERRPIGCRVYFCDPGFAEQQVELSERYIRRLKSLHEELDRPWRYQPLVTFLAEVAPLSEETSFPANRLNLVELA